MRLLDDEALGKYLFNLLESDEKKKIEKELKHCQASRQRLNSLKAQFRQLGLLEKRTPSKVNYTLLAALAAIITVFFFFRPETPLQNNNDRTEFALHLPVESDIKMVLETFAQPANDYSLLTCLPAPIPQKIEINFPEVSLEVEVIQEESQNLRTYLKSILSPKYENTAQYSLNYYCNLQLNHEYKIK
jgi:hypothetical protein